jgi:DNA-binding NarL/FixJ family response regulator
VRRPPPPPQRMVGDTVPADCSPFRRSTVLLAMLTPRQRKVLWTKASGLTNGEVGAELGISEQTVKRHIDTMLQRADCHSFPQYLLAIEWTRVPSLADE